MKLSMQVDPDKLTITLDVDPKHETASLIAGILLYAVRSELKQQGYTVEIGEIKR